MAPPTSRVGRQAGNAGWGDDVGAAVWGGERLRLDVVSSVIARSRVDSAAGALHGRESTQGESVRRYRTKQPCSGRIWCVPQCKCRRGVPPSTEAATERAFPSSVSPHQRRYSTRLVELYIFDNFDTNHSTSNSPCPTGSSRLPVTVRWHSCRGSALPATGVRSRGEFCACCGVEMVDSGLNIEHQLPQG